MLSICRSQYFRYNAFILLINILSLNVTETFLVFHSQQKKTASLDVYVSLDFILLRLLILIMLNKAL